MESMAVRKKVLRRCIIGILFISVFVSYAVAADRGQIRTSTKAQLIENTVSYAIDSVQVAEDVKIRGWALILGEEMKTVDCNVMLIGEESGKQWILPTMVVDRNDLTETFLDGTDYAKAGFLANIRKDRLDLEKEDYRIYLEYLTNGHLYLVATDQKVRAVRETLWQETDSREAGISFLVDSIAAKSKVLTIRGWLFCKEDIDKQTKTEVLLLNSRTGKAYVVPTDKEERIDLAEHFKEEETGYREDESAASLKKGALEQAGFCASLETWQFDFGYDQFEVCLRYTNESEVYLIHTGQYVNLEEQEER